MPRGDGTGPKGQGAGTGQGGRMGGGGQGMGGGQRGGPGGNCVCPKCGHKASHQTGQPCYQIECPQCKTMMVHE